MLSQFIISDEYVSPAKATVNAEAVHEPRVLKRRLELHAVLREGVVREPEQREACMVKMPEHFEIAVEYKDWNTAHKYSYYPGAVSVDAKTVSFASDDYYEIMRFMHFCL